MILPEDTKAPIPSDDEDFDFDDDDGDFDDDFAPSTPPEHHPALHYGERNYDYPSSPNSTATRPLLPLEDDIELGPAPPYSPHDPQRHGGRGRGRRPDGKGELRHRVGKRFILGVAGAAGLCVGLMAISTVGWLIWGKGRHRPHSGPGPGPGHDGASEDAPRPQFPHNGRFDGEPLGCVNFSDSALLWSAFPASNDQPHLPAPLDSAIGSRRSVNSTFIVPTHGGNAVFAHLTFGPAAIGNMFVSTYDAASDDVYAEVSGHSTIAQNALDGELPRKGEYVRIVVETIYDVLPGVADAEPATVDNSPAWEMLSGSKVCLMQRNATNPADNMSLVKRDEEQRHRPDHRPPHHRDSSGVSVFTQPPAHTVHSNVTGSSPLQFRFHIAIPSSDPQNKAHSLVDSLIDALSLSPPDHGQRGNYVPSLEVKGGASSIYVDDLLGAAGIREISLGSGFGEILIEKLQADEISLKTTGNIGGAISVSQRLDADTAIGDIDLDITVATPSPFALPPFDWPPVNGSELSHPPSPAPDGCDYPPVQVDARSASGQTTVRYTGWEEPCLGLNQELLSITGDVKVFAHPLFQGSYRLSTATGAISVDMGAGAELPDPEDQGRWRNITMSQRDRLGDRLWSGYVTWESNGAASETGSEGAGEGEGEDGASSPRPPPPHSNRRVDRVMNAKSSVGAVDLIF